MDSKICVKICVYSIHLLFLTTLANVTAVAKLYGIEVTKDGVKFMKTDRLGIGFKLQKPLFRIKDVINRNNVIGLYFVK